MVDTAIVTGASSGIGQAAARRMAAHGMGVVLTYSSRKDDAESTVAEIEAAGGSAVAMHLDVADIGSFPGFIDALKATTQDKWNTQQLTALVNNAGVGGGAPFEDVTEDQFDRFHLTLFKGPYFLTQKLLPLLADGGSIVNTGSTSALATGTHPGYSHYAAQKGAVHTLTRCWSREFAARRIRVNAVAPGSTRTRLADNAFAELTSEQLEWMSSNVALGRIGEPEDIAGLIAFLAGPESAWITGQVIECSGGERS